MYELKVKGSFSAAHALKGYEGPCENLHGHTFKVEIVVQGKKLDKLGLLSDFKTLKKILSDALQIFDHQDLCQLKYFKIENPSAENLARIIYVILKPQAKGLSKVAVWESDSACASYFE